MSEKSLYDCSRLLIASLVLADPARRSLPALPEVLDRALASARADGAYPEWFWARLTFVDGRMGRMCLELEQMRSDLQDGELLALSIAPAREGERILCSERVARFILRRMDVDPEDARRWGGVLWTRLGAQDAATRRSLQEAGML